MKNTCQFILKILNTIKVLLIIYFDTFLTWAKDNNPSLDKTMTTLDNYLQRAENIIKFFK